MWSNAFSPNESDFFPLECVLYNDADRMHERTETKLSEKLKKKNIVK